MFGSIDRFIGILIEHYAGKFPVWLSPVQVKILPVSDKYNDYANEIKSAFQNQNIRVELDNRDEKLGYKIRESRMDKVPYMIIVGEKEQNNHSISVRQRGDEAQNQDMGEMSLDEFVRLLNVNGGI